METNERPLIITIFGATGDLAQKKLFPALYNLFCKGLLPGSFSVIANSRRPWTHDDFRSFTKPTLLDVIDKANVDITVDSFLSHIRYHEGILEAGESFRTLSEVIKSMEAEAGIEADLLMYLSISPHFYEAVINHVKDRLKHRKQQGGWTRMLVEKPFGRNESSARALNRLLLDHFEEQELFRVDHYLAKFGVHGLETLRKEGLDFDSQWNSGNIERVEFELLETKTVGKRGVFYDQVGALRDVGQNHLLEMAAAAFADIKGDAAANRAHVLSKLRLGGPIEKSVTRGQYERYREEIGAESTKTETFFELSLALDMPRYAGIEIVVRGGKSMPEARSGMTITYKKNTGKPRLFIPASANDGRTSIDFPYYSEDGYEGVFRAGIAGKGDVFASFDEILASWKLVDRIEDEWNLVPLQSYSKDKPII